MTFITKLIKAIVNAAEAIYEFVAGPFVTVATTRNQDVFNQAVFSVALRVLFLLGCIGCTGMLIAIATLALKISFCLMVFSIIVDTIEIFAGRTAWAHSYNAKF